MVYLQVVALSIGILFMLTFMFIGIWLFIVALKAYNQLCYKNYILEKIHQRLSSNNNKLNDEILTNEIEEIEDIFEE
ncbi:MAG: hypothetical protein ACRC2K_06445 [Clostridium sp.]